MRSFLWNLSQLLFCFMLCLFSCLSFMGCEESADKSAITSGTNYTEEQHKAMQNVDLNSYAEVSDVFLDTSSIKSNGKPYFLVFSANGCVYCDRLKQLIKDNPDIKEFLKQNYAPYYINMSYSKMHSIEFLQDSLETVAFAQKYGIKPTPTLVFLDKSGKELFVYPGFMPKDKFLKTLQFLKDPTLEQNSSAEIHKKLQNYLQEEV